MRKNTDKYSEELIYWGTIENLVSFVWFMEHQIRTGKIIPTPKDEEDISSAKDRLQQLYDDIFLLYGVIHPQDSLEKNFDKIAPPGMIWYKDWYLAKKREYSLIEYEQLLCSACPFSGGFEEFLADMTEVPCRHQLKDSRCLRFFPQDSKDCAFIKEYPEEMNVERLCYQMTNGRWISEDKRDALYFFLKKFLEISGKDINSVLFENLSAIIAK